MFPCNCVRADVVRPADAHHSGKPGTKSKLGVKNATFNKDNCFQVALSREFRTGILSGEVSGDMNMYKPSFFLRAIKLSKGFYDSIS